MKLYESEYDDIVKDITNTIEKESDKKIFTLKLLDRTQKEELDTIIVFEDKSVLLAQITVQRVDGRLAVRTRGNYL